MKRYYPTEEERERLHRAERMLGIPSSGEPASTLDPRAAAAGGSPTHGPPAANGAADSAPSRSQPGITRMSISAWRDLWRSDPQQWLRDVRDRPRRFDSERWRRAVLHWRNETPPTGITAPLHGVPILVKDLFDVTGEETRCGSAVLGVAGSDGGPPVKAAHRDAWLVARLRAEGASFQGRTAMNEFAYGIDGRNRVTGDCPHPLDPSRISGGSSSGSAWAVAGGVVPVALGSDTGGSIRVPAALCGIYGYRLPWAEHRLWGTFPLSPRMDTVGWFVAGAEDVSVMLQLAGSTAAGTRKDSRGAAAPSEAAGPQEALAGTEPATGPVRVAALIPPEVSLDAEVRERWDQAMAFLRETEGIALEAVEPPEILGTDAWKAYNVIGSSDAATVHGEWLDRYQELYDPLVWSLIDRGRRWSSERIVAAERTREEVGAYLRGLLATYDVLAMPVTPSAGPTTAAADGTFREAVLRLNAPVSLAGLGALTVPLPHDAVRSSGMQLVIPSGAESRLMKVLSRLG
ncbi:MAG: amidase [Alkalispirochaeta sp.]